MIVYSTHVYVYPCRHFTHSIHQKRVDIWVDVIHEWIVDYMAILLGLIHLNYINSSHSKMAEKNLIHYAPPYPPTQEPYPLCTTLSTTKSTILILNLAPKICKFFGG